MMPLTIEQEERKRNTTILEKKIADKVLMERVTRKWSQEMLAEKSGLHRNHIGHVERNEKGIKVETIYQIAKAFNMTLAEFFKDIS